MQEVDDNNNTLFCCFVPVKTPIPKLATFIVRRIIDKHNFAGVKINEERIYYPRNGSCIVECTSEAREILLDLLGLTMGLDTAQFQAYISLNQPPQPQTPVIVPSNPISPVNVSSSIYMPLYANEGSDFIAKVQVFFLRLCRDNQCEGRFVDWTLEVTSRSTDSLQICRAKINTILLKGCDYFKRNRDISQEVWVYVDESNIFRNATPINETNRVRYYLDAPNLVNCVVNFQRLAKLMVVGSSSDNEPAGGWKVLPRWKQWGEKAELCISRLAMKANGTYYESVADNSLLYSLNVDIPKMVATGGKLVILTGDGNKNGGEGSFVEMVEVALKNSIPVELWSWKQSTSHEYLRISRANSNFVLIYLDDYRPLVVTTTPPSK